jgi:hypothetical protein
MAEYKHLSNPDPDLVQALKAMSQMPKMKEFVTGRESMKTGLLPHIRRKLGPQLPPGANSPLCSLMEAVSD